MDSLSLLLVLKNIHICLLLSQMQFTAETEKNSVSNLVQTRSVWKHVFASGAHKAILQLPQKLDMSDSEVIEHRQLIMKHRWQFDKSGLMLQIWHTMKPATICISSFFSCHTIDNANTGWRRACKNYALHVAIFHWRKFLIFPSFATSFQLYTICPISFGRQKQNTGLAMKLLSAVSAFQSIMHTACIISTCANV